MTGRLVKPLAAHPAQTSLGHGIFGLTALLVAIAPFPACAAEGYTVDPEHSYVHFSVSHFWFATTHGRFERISGHATLDKSAQKGAVEITIDASSINTDIDLRDRNLRSPNFFDVARFPDVIYQSSALVFNGDTPVSIEGSLTLLGVSRPVTLTITDFKCSVQPEHNQEVCNTTANTRIRRSDFGMKYALPLVGDEIELVFGVAAVKKE